MKPLSEQDHYEVLEIPRDTGSDGIERAYRLILATYAEDSLATYSMVRGADSAAIRERVETAYRVLSDAQARRSYDSSLGGGRPAPTSEFDESPEIAVRTKVNSSYLAFLEEERFVDLPPRVYVRGFVMAFAACLGLDSTVVAASYMRRYDAERPRQRRRFSRGP